MPPELPDADASPVELVTVANAGFWISIDDRELYLPFAWFPWFRNATIEGLSTINRPNPNHLYWPDLDVHVAVAFIEHPAVNDRDMPLSKAAHRVLALASDEAQRLGHPYVGSEHLVLALTREPHGTIEAALHTLGIDAERVRATLETTADPGTAVTRGQRLSYTSTVKNVFGLAKSSAQALGEREVSVDHLLLSVLEASGVGSAVLAHHGLSAAALRNYITSR